MDQGGISAVAQGESAGSDPPLPRQAVEQTWVVRAPLVFAGVVLPVVCFLVINLPRFDPHMAPGHATLLMMYPASLALSPFLLYSMISMWLVVFRPGEFDRNNFLRFGVFSGVLTAAEYCAIFHSVFWYVSETLAFAAAFCMVSALAVLLPMGILWLDIRMARKYGLAYISLTLAAIVGILVVLTGETVLLAVLGLCCAFSTAWALAAYAFVSIRLIGAAPPPRFRYSLAQLLAVTTWFAAHCAAWRCAFLLILHE